MSTARASTRAGLKTVLDSYLAANSGLLTAVYDHRPPSFNPPIAFIGGLNEPTIRTDAGLRNRNVSAQVLIVHRAADNDTTSDQVDVLVDGLLDAFTAAPHAVGPGSILTGEMSVEDADIQLKDVVYVGTVITVQVAIHEARP